MQKAKDDDTNEQDDDLDAEEARRYRAIAARFKYLAVDGADIQFAVKHGQVDEQDAQDQLAHVAQDREVLLGTSWTGREVSVAGRRQAPDNVHGQRLGWMH